MKVAGDGQTADPGAAVASPPAVLACDAFWNPLPGLPVAFGVSAGSGSQSGASAVTSSAGIATVGGWILGATPGVNRLSATGAGLDGSPQVFTATGVDHTAPRASGRALTPGPRGTAVDSICIVFSEPVVHFDVSDLHLTRDGGPNLLTGAEALATTDSVTWSLGTAALTGPAGTYVLAVGPADITDAAGNALAAGVSVTWVVASTTSRRPGPARARPAIRPTSRLRSRLGSTAPSSRTGPS